TAPADLEFQQFSHDFTDFSRELPRRTARALFPCTHQPFALRLRLAGGKKVSNGGMAMRRIFPVLALGAALLGADALAQDAARPPVGPPISLEQAKKAIAAAEAEAVRNRWNTAIAIVEPNGALVYFVKMDGTQYGAVNAALDKATSAALFRRSTNA